MRLSCKGCGKTVHDWFGDAWCDPCGGVMARPGVLIMRHVATVDGAGGRLPIVWDVSGNFYKFRHPNKKNPRWEKAQKEAEERKAKNLGERVSLEPEFLPVSILTIDHQSLDAVITMAQPVAQGDSEEWPELSGAPSATESEKKILGV